MLMAIYLNGIDVDETAYLTDAMISSGSKLSWDPNWKDCLVDKHSTGGIGDKISLVLAPALAACGMKVPMMSGRSLGHTGGTLNKLESIPGFCVNQSEENCRKILTDVGCCIISQSKELAPADKILYQSRDQTNTVSEMGLITGSIISKKGVEGIHGLVLDVKYGKAAFMTTEAKAKQLAERMVETSCKLGIKTRAVLTKMDYPLGKMASNGTLEMIESVQCLKGNGPKDIMELVTNQGAHLLLMMKKVQSLEEGLKKIQVSINDGTALKKFQDMMVAQGVDNAIAHQLCQSEDTWQMFTEQNRTAKCITEFKVDKDGYVQAIDALCCGKVIMNLGAMEVRADEDYGIGMEFCVSVGDPVSKGQTWVKVHHNKCSDRELTNFSEEIQSALTIGCDKIPEGDLRRIKEVIVSKSS
ncbi:thymidine phosphorylase [Octopus bimaculoides]|uniref:Thymidine phosphorylase n=1 Tax=Octopus bimaculoides TaxID=37653 RepID=A0A0L8GLL0_OCTBM|nr:thymidine phosphorylase [Octopus bimaculoides]|eukprot:XP_014780217.1 PREDICTED: thymidine phosphorylase-like [Octopus bimaculoides]